MDTSHVPNIAQKGISSVQLAKDIGVCQKTAWFVLHRIRKAFENTEECEELARTIMADETFVGGKNKNIHYDKKVEKSQGRSFKDKTAVLGLMQRQRSVVISRPHKLIPDSVVAEKAILQQSKIKCFVTKDTSTKSAQPLIRKTVEKGSTFVSDEWFAYRGLNSDYEHHVVDHSKGSTWMSRDIRPIQ